MTTPAENALGYKLAKRIARRLLQQYVRVSPEDNIIFWSDYAARDSYYLICSEWRLKREA